MPHLQFMGGKNKLPAVPETGTGFEGTEIKNQRKDKHPPAKPEIP